MKYSLRELRARKDESQQEVADAISVGLSTYTRWEKEASNIGIANVAKLAAHFGVEITEIKY